jgi:hypothetical protein
MDDGPKQYSFPSKTSFQQTFGGAIATQEEGASVWEDTRMNTNLGPSASFDPDKEFHIIFSTGCTQKQHWQSYVLFHSTVESGQTGHVTRIASGCQPEEMEKLHATQIVPMGKHFPNSDSRFHLHLTPEFGSVHSFASSRFVQSHNLSGSTYSTSQ